MLPLTGTIIVAPPARFRPRARPQCTRARQSTAAWILQLELAGQKINLPAYVMPTAGAEAQIGPAKIVFCLAPPDIPVAKGGAANGAKFISADLTVNGVFCPVSVGCGIAFWTPWQAGNGQVNAAGTVASPAAIAPGALTVKVAKSGLVRSKVSGKVTQGGRGSAAPGSRSGPVSSGRALKKVATTTTKADGSYSFTYGKKAAFFRTRTVVAGRTAPPLCTQLQAALPVPCVNPTVNGFTARARSRSGRRKRSRRTEERAPQAPSPYRAAGWNSSIGLPDGSSITICLPPGAGHDVVAERQPRRAKPLDVGGDVVDDQVDAIPSRPAAAAGRQASGAQAELSGPLSNSRRFAADHIGESRAPRVDSEQRTRNARCRTRRLPPGSLGTLVRRTPTMPSARSHASSQNHPGVAGVG